MAKLINSCCQVDPYLKWSKWYSSLRIELESIPLTEHVSMMVLINQLIELNERKYLRLLTTDYNAFKGFQCNLSRKVQFCDFLESYATSFPGDLYLLS